MSDLIDRQESKDISEINKFIDGLEEIFADIRERHVDDSVCGLCEYDGAYMGQSGDWCNECPGFDKDDCFKLSDETRKKWIEEIVNAYPDHIADIGKKAEGDCISRQAAIEALARVARKMFTLSDEFNHYLAGLMDGENAIRQLPSVQPERDIPIKPNETIDRAWGIPHRQAVCPKCDCYLGKVVFLGDGKGKKVTYCETCGQAIDWEGWDFDE